MKSTYIHALSAICWLFTGVMAGVMLKECQSNNMYKAIDQILLERCSERRP